MQGKVGIRNVDYWSVTATIAFANAIKGGSVPTAVAVVARVTMLLLVMGGGGWPLSRTGAMARARLGDGGGHDYDDCEHFSVRVRI